MEILSLLHPRDLRKENAVSLIKMDGLQTVPMIIIFWLITIGGKWVAGILEPWQSLKQAQLGSRNTSCAAPDQTSLP
jgi:hypothetical protein